MNTVKKGDNFEEKVFNYIKSELENNNFFVSQQSSKIYSKNKYFSKDRNSNIITDISIETFLPQATEYSILTVIECKDYSKPIPVDDIEEFYSKVQQIAGVNVKAIFATTASLQSGALSFAKSKKIGIIRFLPSNQVEWYTHFITMDTFKSKPKQFDNRDFNSAFLNQNHIGKERNFYACDGQYIYGSLYSIHKEFLTLNN